MATVWQQGIVQDARMSTADQPDIIQRIPEPDVIRERLAVLVREADTLRKLLRVAERAKQNRQAQSREGAIDAAR